MHEYVSFFYFNTENTLETAAHNIFLRTETVNPCQLKHITFSVTSDVPLFNI